MTVNRKQIGKIGEEAAASYLINQGMKVAARNWRCRSGEIDLIVFDKEQLVFVEVRTRTVKDAESQKYGSVLEAVTLRKQQQVRKVAEVYLYQAKLIDVSVRFDVVFVEYYKQNHSNHEQSVEQSDDFPTKVTHIPYAF